MKLVSFQYKESKKSSSGILLEDNILDLGKTFNFDSINEIITKITDILTIKDASFFDIMEFIDLINVSIAKF